MSVLARLPWLLTMQAVLLTALVYPLRLKDEWLNYYVPLWRDNADGSSIDRFCFEQFSSFISYFHSPLTLKGVVAAVCLLAVILVALAGRAALPLVLREGIQPSRNYRAPFALILALVGFAGWTAASTFWSPTPRVSLDGVTFVLIFGGFLFYLLRRGIAADEARQLTLLLIGIGTIVAFISLLEASEASNGFIFNFLYRFDDAEKRNLYGSLLGHNTAVGHFMMISAFPALALALDARGRPTKWIALAYVPLALITALVTQSRSIWAAGFLLGFGYLYCIARLHGKRWPWRLTFYVTGALAFALALQLIPSNSNPFYIESNPILRRFKDMTPAHMKEEARTRLFVCSLPLVAEKPIIGHGLYAFQYVYPKAQAEYFARHPNSELGRTAYRSNMAHNEYLQILVESGVVGLGAFLLMLCIAARTGLRANRQLDPADRLLHAAFGFAALGTCLDAFVNFPFHVPQLALPWVMSLGAFCAWRPDSPQPHFVTLGLSAEANESDGSPTRFRPEHVARLVATWGFLFAIPLAAMFPMRLYQADINYMNGSGYVNSWRIDGPRMPSSAREDFFVKGDHYLREAVATQPSHDLARYSLGELYYLHGYYMARDEAAAAGGTPPFYAPAIAQINTAIEYLKNSTESLDYHNTYFTLALCYDVLRSTATDPEERAHYDRSYKESLETCLFYAPTLFEGLHLMDRWLVAQAKPESDRIIEIRRRIKHYFPQQYRDFYQYPVLRLMEAQDWEGASQGADALLAVDSENPEYLVMSVDAYMYSGHHEKLFAAVNKLQGLKVNPEVYTREYETYRQNPSHPIYWCLGILWSELAAKNWGKAIAELEQRGAQNAHGTARLWAIQKILREKLQIENLPSRFGKFEGFSEGDWNLFRQEVLAEVLTFLFQDYERAKQVCQERLAMPGPPPGIKFWINYGWLARRMQDPVLLTECVEKIRELEPKHPILARMDSPIPVVGLGPR